MLVDSTFVRLSLVVLAGVALTLGTAEFRRYRAQHLRAHLFWSVGLGLVALTLGEEAAFLAGVDSPLLLGSYLFLVAFLVGVLSLGSAEAGLSGRGRIVYFGYVAAASAATLVACLTEPVSSSLLNNGIVTGNPPTGIVVASTLLTVPAAVLMAATSLWTARRLQRWRLAWIALGIIVISVAGGLYIASVPETLYYAEFLGVVFLYLGFGGVRPFAVRHPVPSPA